MKISLLVLLMVVEMTKSMNSYVRGNSSTFTFLITVDTKPLI